ncbi:MAG TPA: hypothetical protein PKD38_20155 [Nitrospira sp.]|nr:hypothetical protein [Nitrospira sp.]
MRNEKRNVSDPFGYDAFGWGNDAKWWPVSAINNADILTSHRHIGYRLPRMTNAGWRDAA